jgi:hypothetical protein
MINTQTGSEGENAEKENITQELASSSAIYQNY